MAITKKEWEVVELSMNLSEFSHLADLADQTELERCARLVFFLSRNQELREVSLTDLFQAIEQLHFPLPNKSRLRKKVKSSRAFVAVGPEKLRLHASEVARLRELFPNIERKSEEIKTEHLIIPNDIYASAPSYIVRLADQINSSYDNNIFDGCAVLMRRLLEVLFIKTYQKQGIEARIQDSAGRYKLLEGIISDAKTNNKLGLSRNTKVRLDDYRNLGNFAAHRIEFGTRRGDVNKLQLEYRATVEELLHKAGLTH